MKIRNALSTGMFRVSRTPRLVMFAWAVNLSLALLLALPMMSLLDSSIGGTVYEESLVRRMDQNWWASFKMDHAASALVRLLDESVMGYAPFLQHTETLLHGGFALPIASFVADLLVRWNLSPGPVSLLVLLGSLLFLINAVLSASFISTYRGDYPPTISEFLSLGAAHFGPFFRLGLVVLLLQAVIVYPIINGLSDLIASGTASSPSEQTPFYWYLARNLVAFVLLLFVTLSGDYARVRLVVEARTSATSALIAGAGFVVRHAGTTAGLGCSLLGLTLGAMVVYALLQQVVPAALGWGVLLLFIVQQTYIIARQWVRALTYASETDLFQSSGIRS